MTKLTIKRVNVNHHYRIHVHLNGRLVRNKKWVSGQVTKFRKLPAATQKKGKKTKRISRVQIVIATTGYIGDLATITIRVWANTNNPAKYSTEEFIGYARQMLLQLSWNNPEIREVLAKADYEAIEERQISRIEASDMDIIHGHIRIHNKNGGTFDYNLKL
jgi:hypothetical protein